MSNRTKKALYSLLAAALTAAAAGIFCLFAAPPRENGSSLVCFTESSPKNRVVDTEITRSISALRSTVTEDAFLEKAGMDSGISAAELRGSVTVARFGSSSGAEIVLSGLKAPEEAPIILMNILYLAKNSPDIPPFMIISGYDVSRTPRQPYPAYILSAGLVGGLVCFLIMSSAERKGKTPSRQNRIDNDNDYQYALYMQKFVEEACRAAADLGALPLSAPEGLEKSGYTDAAEKIAEACKSSSAKIVAVSSELRSSDEQIPPEAKITAYLACALAEKGIRTAVIDCCLRSPSIARFFKISPKGGLSDIVAGSCTVWDALAVNARRGVDVIAESKEHHAPMEVFSSPAYRELLEYLSPQYDIILLCAPKAWRSKEWTLVTSLCKGFVILHDKGTLYPDTARGILGQKEGFAALCTLKKPPDDMETNKNAK